jgi:hypothetical protein
MRRTVTVTLAAVVLALTAWAVRGAAAGSTAQSTRSAAATMREQSDQRKALYQSQLEQNHQHQHPAVATTGPGLPLPGTRPTCAAPRPTATRSSPA